ncbi:MAG TPA: homoserine kinase [Gaiellales bacterium]|nr:homoserine kinase [Gaiellales bacterium]
MPERLRVTAPASSANLGPGFDCLAVALELRNEVEVTRLESDEVRVVVEGEGAGEAPEGLDNLFVQAFAAAGGDPQGLEFRMLNRVPFARGLGSSAATIAAGVIAGLAWSGGDGDPLRLTAELEGHPDNAAAAVEGGLTLAWKTPAGPRALRLGRCPVEFVAVVPPDELSTEQARAALPPQVSHYDAAYTAGRAALLVAALDAGRLDLVGDALDDRLHEPFRAPLVPLLAEVRARILDLPALGATLSGAGPTVLVWCEPGSGASVAASLGDLAGARSQMLEVASAGARLE